MLLNESIYTHLQTLYSLIHVLNFEKLFHLQILKFVHKRIYYREFLPVDFKNYFELVSNIHGLNLRNPQNLQIFSTNSTMGNRNLKILASRIWNTYPQLQGISNIK